MLSKEEIARYSRQMLLDDVGVEGQLKIKAASVAVIGAGGIGCPLLQCLAATGVGTLGLIDADTVSLSNLHRQLLYREEDAGRKKVAVAADRLKQLNPFVQPIVHDLRLDSGNVSLLGAYDIVVDGSDNFQTRYLVNDACVSLGKPLVYGSILGYELQVAVFNRAGSRHLRDLFPEAPDPASVPDCSVNGVLPPVTAIAGNIMAQAVLDIILGKPSLENKLLLQDLRSMRQQLLELQ